MRRKLQLIGVGLIASVLACGSGAELAGAPAITADDDLAVLRGAARPVGSVAEMIGDAHLVLMGEATHGTHEFYEARAELTKQLIERGSLDAVAIEGDFTSASRVDRYVRGMSTDRDAPQALAGFDRFPRWMWRNEVVAGFVEWLRDYNDALPEGRSKIGLYGIDVYDPGGSAAAVVRHLEARSPRSAKRAQRQYACLLAQGDDPSAMSRSLARSPGCAEAIRAFADELGPRAAFDLRQHAHVVAGAARYWDAQLTGSEPSWNVRDTHMADTVDRLLAHLRATADAKVRIAVWAHNSHLGDARATEMSRRGEHNLGQLLRERHPGHVFNLGFSTFDGEVTAADDWGEPTKRKQVLPGRPDSYEGLLHAIAVPELALDLRDPKVREVLNEPRLYRAIGVIYRPETERASHYFESRLADQFDAVIHFDETTALRPLDPPVSWQRLTSSNAS